VTPQYIIRRGLCREPHCFSAHVPGQGYINRGNVVGPQREEFIRQYLRSAESEIENLGYASAYAEPGYTQPAKGILFANWNHLPKGIDTVLERYGYAVEWSDEWATCDDCGKAVRTQPDSYSWTPRYREDLLRQGDIVCLQCEPLPTAEETEEDE
jgi:hypothetical protein